MKNVFFAFMVIATVLFTTSCGGSKSGQKLEEKQTIDQARAAEKNADSAAHAMKNFTATPDSFFVTELKEAKTTKSFTSSECSEKEQGYTVTTESAQFSVTVFVKGVPYQAKNYDESGYVTTGLTGDCFDTDPERKLVKAVRTAYDALLKADNAQIRISVNDGFLNRIKITGKRISERVYEEDFSFRVSGVQDNL